jgi:hypothetical protein
MISKSSAVAIVPQGHPKIAPCFGTGCSAPFVSSPAGTTEVGQTLAVTIGSICLIGPIGFWLRVPKAFQGFPSLLKPLEAFSNHLKGKLRLEPFGKRRKEFVPRSGTKVAQRPSERGERVHPFSFWTDGRVGLPGEVLLRRTGQAESSRVKLSQAQSRHFEKLSFLSRKAFLACRLVRHSF